MRAEDGGPEGREPRIRAEGRGSRNTNTLGLLLFYGEHFYGFSESELS